MSFLVPSLLYLATYSFFQMTAFWDTAPRSIIESGDRSDDGRSKNLWNVRPLLWEYMALYPRRLPSSYSPLWEPDILLCNHY
jgi:hypothetical protein